MVYASHIMSINSFKWQVIKIVYKLKVTKINFLDYG